jgi:dUTP pyrophosphatase
MRAPPERSLAGVPEIPSPEPRPQEMAPIEIPFVRLSDDASMPGYARPGDAGADLVASEAAFLPPGGGRALVSTGLAVAIPEGFAGFVQPRSGLALRHGVTCLNTPGLIDSGYRGELKVLLVNTDPETAFEVNKGERIAQLVIQAVASADFVEVDELSSTDRGAGGFGSTGR